MSGMGNTVWPEAARLVFILFMLPKGRRPDDLRFFRSFDSTDCRLLISTPTATDPPPTFAYPTAASAYMEPVQSPNLLKARTTPACKRWEVVGLLYPLPSLKAPLPTEEAESTFVLANQTPP